MLDWRNSQKNLFQYYYEQAYKVSCHLGIGDTVVKVTPKCLNVQSKVYHIDH